MPLNDTNKNKIFRPFSHFEENDIYPEITDYEKVYDREMLITKININQLLNDLFREFNIDHPEDYKHRSLSVSDVIAIEYDGFITAYYVDTIGFVQLHKFFKIPKELDIKELPLLPYYLLVFSPKSDIVFEEFDDTSESEFTSQVCSDCMQKHKTYLKASKENPVGYKVSDLLCGMDRCGNHASHIITIPKKSNHLIMCAYNSD